MQSCHDCSHFDTSISVFGDSGNHTTCCKDTQDEKKKDEGECRANPSEAYFFLSNLGELMNIFDFFSVSYMFRNG